MDDIFNPWDGSDHWKEWSEIGAGSTQPDGV